MTSKLYWTCVAMFILGQLLTLMLMTIPKLRKLSRQANKEFSLKIWWQTDWNLVIATQVIGALVILGLDQILNWKPDILFYVKWFFAALGAFGTTVATNYWSKFENGLNKLMDIKSNVSDKMIGLSNTVNEVKSNFTETTGDSGKSIETPMTTTKPTVE